MVWFAGTSPLNINTHIHQHNITALKSFVLDQKQEDFISPPKKKVVCMVKKTTTQCNWGLYAVHSALVQFLSWVCWVCYFMVLIVIRLGRGSMVGCVILHGFMGHCTFLKGVYNFGGVIF